MSSTINLLWVVSTGINEASCGSETHLLFLVVSLISHKKSINASPNILKHNSFKMFLGTLIQVVHLESDLTPSQTGQVAHLSSTSSTKCRTLFFKEIMLNLSMSGSYGDQF